MEERSTQEIQKYLSTFTVPDLSKAQIVRDGEIGLVELLPKDFVHSYDVSYEFETAVIVEKGTRKKFLVVRIDAYDPAKRAEEPADYCIPLMDSSAPERQKLSWTIPFGGAWSDTYEEAVIFFDSSWIEWFKKPTKGIAFANVGGDAAALMEFNDREWESIRAFCKP